MELAAAAEMSRIRARVRGTEAMLDHRAQERPSDCTSNTGTNGSYAPGSMKALRASRSWSTRSPSIAVTSSLFSLPRRLASSSASGARGPRSPSGGLERSGGGAWGKRGFGTPIRPEGSIIYADKAYNDYEIEDLLKEVDHIHLLPMRKKNSKRVLPQYISFVQHYHRKRIETAGSLIERSCPWALRLIETDLSHLVVVP